MDRSDVFAYVKETFDVDPDYPWESDQVGAVLRHPGNRRWFGLVMTVDRAKLGLPGEGTVDVLNVKADPEVVYLAKDARGILPAYHMSKRHWITLLLDGTVPEDEVTALLCDSYEMTL